MISNPEINQIEPVVIEYSDLDVLIEFGWQVYQNPTTRFYPIVDQKSDIEVMYKQAFMNGWLWAAKIDQVYGVLPLIVDEEHQFIQSNGGVAAQAHFTLFSSYFLDKLKATFPGYTYLSGFPSSHQEAIAYHQKQGFDQADILYRYERELEALTFPAEPYYQTLHASNVEAFVQYHDQLFGNQYWSADLIYQHLDRWSVVLVGEDKITDMGGAIRYTKNQINYAEIYFIASNNSCELIISALLSELQKQGVQQVLYLVNQQNQDQILQLDKMDFKLLDDYCEFSIIL